MKYGVISADIINSSKLTVDELQSIRKNFEELFEELGEKYHFWGRIVRGDFVEVCMSDPRHLLRLSLIIKCIAKSSMVHNGRDTTQFRSKGLRMAMSIGNMDVVSPTTDILSGEAITLAGRKVDSKTAISKGTICMLLGKGLENKGEDSIATLCDAIINNCTAKQCLILIDKLCFMEDRQIAAKHKIYQSAVCQHLSAANWNAIDKALNYFESLTWN